jgi:hypothetical protein
VLCIVEYYVVVTTVGFCNFLLLQQLKTKYDSFSFGNLLGESGMVKLKCESCSEGESHVYAIVLLSLFCVAFYLVYSVCDIL